MSVKETEQIKETPQVSAHVIFNDGSIHVGVWECEPGGWPIVDAPIVRLPPS